jgi:excisionase family DNA binding protein
MGLTEKDIELARQGYRTLTAKESEKSGSKKTGGTIKGATAKRKYVGGTTKSLTASLITGRATRIELPPQAVEAITKVLEQLAQGKEVTVAAKPVEMTTQQAAEFLRVSRPFLIGLLEKGEIPFRRVGAHRRVLYADLQTYKDAIDAKRLKVLEELAAQAQELNMGY